MNRIDDITTLDRFLLRPVHVSSYRQYHVWNRKGDPLLFIVRPAYPFFSVVRAVATVALGLAAFLGASMVLPDKIPELNKFSIQFMAFLTALFTSSLALSTRYKTTIYRDESEREVYLQIQQENRVPIPYSWYTVRDEEGRTLATIRRNHYYRLVLKRWHLFGEDGSLLCIAREDSLVKSVVSRIIGSPTAGLKTNFTLFDGKMGHILGEFNRRRLVFGCYVLDMDSDYRRTIDRRVALALGIMLDAG